MFHNGENMKWRLHQSVRTDKNSIKMESTVKVEAQICIENKISEQHQSCGNTDNFREKLPCKQYAEFQ